jgi:uncharacterized lipoprotein YddW (UPF0748 family)
VARLKLDGVVFALALGAAALVGASARDLAAQKAPVARPAAAQMRAVWIHAGLFPADRSGALLRMRALLDDYRAAGIGAVFCFDSLPAQHGKGWDFLGTLVSEAHARRLQVHPVISPGYTIPLAGEIAQHPEWLITGMKGEMYRNLNLAHPGARRYVLDRVSEALRYEVDGVHLDYTRFPVGQTYSYDRETIDAFRKEFGESPLDVAHDGGSIIWCEWIKWNARQVTTLVRDIRTAVKQKDTRLMLSAAVFPNSAISPVEIGQDWAEWAREGLVDALCPMLYTSDARLFRQYVKDAMQAAKGSGVRVLPGIACLSSHNKNTPAGVASEVAIAEEEGADGAVFFSGYSLDKSFLDAIRPRAQGPGLKPEGSTAARRSSSPATRRTATARRSGSR